MLHNSIKQASAAILAALMGFMLMLPAQAQKKNEYRIKAGTPIEVATTTDISSKHYQLGSVVDLKLLNPVMVKNEVVIPAGTIIKGKVIQSQKGKTFGGKGMIAIEANTITAIDGTLVPISGVSFRQEGRSNLGWIIAGIVVTGGCFLPFGFLVHGTQGVIPAGTQMSGNVMANTTITLDDDGE